MIPDEGDETHRDRSCVDNRRREPRSRWDSPLPESGLWLSLDLAVYRYYSRFVDHVFTAVTARQLLTRPSLATERSYELAGSLAHTAE
jgi:hypothetical protein